MLRPPDVAEPCYGTLTEMSRESNISEENPVEEPYGFSKEKIARNLGYPLKRSLLDFALHSASVYTAVYSVRYLGRVHPADVVLDASFTPDWQGHPTVRGRCLVTVWAVPSGERHRAEQLLVAEALPILCRWLAKGRNESNVRRGTAHMLTFSIRGGTICHSEVPHLS